MVFLVLYTEGVCSLFHRVSILRPSAACPLFYRWGKLELSLVFLAVCPWDKATSLCAFRGSVSGEVLPILLMVLGSRLAMGRCFPLPFILGLLLRVLASRRRVGLKLYLSECCAGVLCFRVRGGRYRVPRRLRRVVRASFFCILVILPLRSPRCLDSWVQDRPVCDRSWRIRVGRLGPWRVRCFFPIQLRLWVCGRGGRPGCLCRILACARTCRHGWFLASWVGRLLCRLATLGA